MNKQQKKSQLFECQTPITPAKKQQFFESLKPIKHKENHEQTNKKQQLF